MSGFANMDEKSLCFIIPRMTYEEFSGVLAKLGDFMIRGDIPDAERVAYQEQAASLHAASRSIKFLQEKFPDIKQRILAEEKKVQNAGVGAASDAA